MSGRRRIYVGLSIAAVLAAGGAAAFYVSNVRASDQAAAGPSASLRSLSRCLLGAPLEEGETPGARLRNIELVSPHPRPENAWPMRCERYSAALERRLEQAKRVDPARYAAVHRHARRLHATLSRGGVPRHIDALYERAREAGLSTEHARSGPTAPAPAEPMRADDIPIFLEGNVLLTPTEIARGGALHLAFGDRRGPWNVCTLSPSFEEVRCREFSAVRGSAHAIVAPGEEGSPPHLIVRGGNEAGIYDARGRRVLDHAPQGVFVRRDGTVIALDGREVLEIGNETERHAIGAPEGAPIGLSWDRVVWLGEAPAEQPRPIFAQRVLLGELAPAVSLGDGPVTPSPDQLVAASCKTSSSLATMFVTAHAHEKDRPTSIAIATDDGGSSVQTLTDIYAPELTCSAENASIAWLLADARGIAVQRRRCSARGCDTLKHPLRFRGSDPYVAQLGDRMLLLYRSPLGDTRMRLAPLEELETAPETILYDDGAHGGLTVLARRVFIREGRALIALRTREGARAIRIDPDGTASAVPAAVSRHH
jgi:hypothetical protein